MVESFEPRKNVKDEQTTDLTELRRRAEWLQSVPMHEDVSGKLPVIDRIKARGPGWWNNLKRLVSFVLAPSEVKERREERRKAIETFNKLGSVLEQRLLQYPESER